MEIPIITLDCDWAPDFVIKEVAEMLSEQNVKATWFVTNDSPILSELMANPLFELGIHPNFDVDSTQGTTVDDVLKNLKKILPDATTIRTHKLIQSTPILLKFQNYGIENDVSLLLFKTPNVEPHYIKYFKLFRFPYFWEDDVQMYEDFEWDINSLTKTKGMKIFNFHPIHIYLNSSNMNIYNNLKKKNSFNSIKKQQLENYINKDSKGVKTMFKSLLNHLKNKETFTISDLRNI